MFSLEKNALHGKEKAVKNGNETITDPERISEVLDRGTIVGVLPSKKEFQERLESGDIMRFYIGFDATAPTLHLSHAKNLQLLEKFRKLGHEVIVLFGDFTAMIGDPSDRGATRQTLSRETVLENVEKWKQLIEPLMDFGADDNPPIIKFNSDWLAKMSLEDVVGLASNTTVQQLLERDMFQKRLSEGKPIHLHEFLYPLMQGFDSVAMDTDVEVCGTDQTFNALMGRNLQKRLNGKDKFVVQVTLMEDPKTGTLMSKSKGTGVFLDAAPEDMFGQIMSQTDEMIRILFVNCTSLSLEEIDEIMEADNPRNAKLRLAQEISKIYHGEQGAEAARAHFERTVSKGRAPEDIPTFDVQSESVVLQNAVQMSGFKGSNSEIRRLAEQGAITVNDDKVVDRYADLVVPPEGLTLRVGKRHWFKIKKA